MKDKLSSYVASVNKLNKKKKRWKQVVSILVTIVVFCTTYALILPAITMEKKTICGLEEHTHISGCYALKPSLTCDPEETVHSHSEACYDENESEICGEVDYVFHSHSEECYSVDEKLVCKFPEVVAHSHIDSCYQVSEKVVQEGHTHSEECYDGEAVICQKQEQEEITEQTEKKLVCELKEVVKHEHNDECYEEEENGEKALICGEIAVETHIHSESCYGDKVKTLECVLPEHTHIDSCYLKCPECGEIEEHKVDCPNFEFECSCGTETDVHKKSCPLYVKVCTCGFENGIHTVDCPVYETPEVELGKNPTYKGVGQLIENFDTNTYTQFMLMTADDDLASDAVASGSTVDIYTADKSIVGTKSVTDTNEVDEDGDPIYTIDLNLESASKTLGASCDFVLVLDMSYSMSKGDNLAQLKKACTEFVTELARSSPYSRVAIVTYGGNKNANKYYIAPYNNTSAGTNSVISLNNTNNDVVLYEKVTSGEKEGFEPEDQQWFIEHTSDGYMHFINVKTGLALNVNGSVKAGYSTLINATEVNNSASQNFIMTNVTGTTNNYYFTSQLLDSTTKFNLDYTNGQTHNLNPVLVWNFTTTTVTNPQRWVVTRVNSSNDYESYYWTDSSSEIGYGNRTDHSSADSALMLTSQASENGKREVNEKLINAINALTVYGGKFEGSHAGEAMEKATRIYQNVRIDDENDYCEPTDEYYYNCKRGVLYFADGAPSPTDSVELYNYPNNNEEGMVTYGVSYDFVETYTDVQDALNWGKVLKYERGQNIVASGPGYDDDGNYETNHEPFDMYYINPKGTHQYSEYYDVGATTVTGCGATVYALSINLATVDLLSECTSNHSHIYRQVLMENGEYVNVCVTRVNDPLYFYDGFDSRSNEYFYRLSSHREDSSHVSFGDPAARSASQQSWHEVNVGTSFNSPTKGWSGRYPDFLCRNQAGSYFVSCDNASELARVFYDIAYQPGVYYEDLSMIDNISPYFVICDVNGNPFEVGDRLLPDGTRIPDGDPDPIDGLFGTIIFNEELGCQCVSWIGFGLYSGDKNGNGRQVFGFSFHVTPKDGFIGGNAVPTNSGVVLTNAEEVQIGASEANPAVDVVIKPQVVSVPNINAYLGDPHLQNFTLDNSGGMLKIFVNNFLLDLANEDNYGLDWQDDYVDISVVFLDENDNEMPNGFTDVRENQNFKVKVIVDPLYEGRENTEITSNEGIIKVFYPELKFKDSWYYFGETIPNSTILEDNALIADETRWRDADGVYSDSEGIVMNSNTVPEIVLTCTPDYEGTAMPNVDVPVDVTVASVGYVENPQAMSYFDWQECFPSCDNTIELHPANQVTPEFYLHPRADIALPNTGGIGTHWYIFSGFALVFGAMSLLYRKKRNLQRGRSD